MNGKPTAKEKVAIRIINLLIIKSVWWVTTRKKGETIFSLNIITRHAYQEVLNGEPPKYNIDEIKKILSPGSRDEEETIKQMLNGSICLMADDNDYNYVLNGIMECLIPGSPAREIQRYEKMIREYVSKQKKEFEKAAFRCSSHELRKMFRFFIHGDAFAPDYDLKTIEKALESIPFGTFKNNINIPGVLERHEKAVSNYLIKLRATIALREEIKTL